MKKLLSYFTYIFFITLISSLLNAQELISRRIEWSKGSRPEDISLNEFIQSIASIKLSISQSYKHPYTENGWKFCRDTSFVEAIAQFKIAEDKVNSDVDLLWGKGLAYAGLEQYDSSLINLWAAYNLDIENIYLIMSLANVYENLNMKYSSSPMVTNTMVTNTNEANPSPTFLAESYLDTAIKIYYKALLLFPNYDYLSYCLGRTLVAKGEYTEALEKFYKAKSLGYKIENNVLIRLAEQGEKMKEAISTATLYNYSPDKLLLYISVEEQNMLVCQNGRAIKAYRISTGKTGSSYGAKMGTNQTPLGIHKLVDKIGDGAEFGTIFKSRRNTGRVAPIVRDSAGLAQKLHDYVLTRVFIIDGLEQGINKGRDNKGRLVDSKARCIYIHGTNNELMLGTPVSYGCIRMFNEDAISLFNESTIGDYVIIE